MALFALDALGEEPDLRDKRGVISVFALGEESVVPDVLTLDFFIKSEAELGVDAVTKYRDSVERIRESLQKFEITDVKVEEGGLILLRRVSETGKSSMAVQRQLHLTVGKIDRLSEEELLLLVARLMDTVADAGGDVSSAARFIVSDHTNARKQAVDKALRVARENAEYLASKSQIKLGEVACLHEIDNLQRYQPRSQAETSNALRTFPNLQPPTDESFHLQSISFKPLIVRVSIRAQFYIQPIR